MKRKKPKPNNVSNRPSTQRNVPPNARRKPLRTEPMTLKLLKKRPAILVGVLCATLSACATDSNVKFICPTELYQTREKTPSVPEGAEITGNEVGQDWLGRVVRHSKDSDRILEDSRKGCPDPNQ